MLDQQRSVSQRGANTGRLALEESRPGRVVLGQHDRRVEHVERPDVRSGDLLVTAQRLVHGGTLRHEPGEGPQRARTSSPQVDRVVGYYRYSVVTRRMPPSRPSLRTPCGLCEDRESWWSLSLAVQSRSSPSSRRSWLPGVVETRSTSTSLRSLMPPGSPMSGLQHLAGFGHRVQRSPSRRTR
jgi:hypothetical protein